MSQIKEKQEARDRGEWNALPPNERQEQDSNLGQLGMLARFHNLMGLDTIHTIELFSQEPKCNAVFTHNVIVDRIAAMLNYFLLHLVS